MADSRRLLVLKQLVIQMETIKIENGYNHDVAKVSRQFKAPSNAKNLPRIQVLARPETIRPETHRAEGVMNYSDPFNVDLLNYVQAPKDIDDTGILGDVIEDHIEDIKKCWYSNPTLGFDWLEESAIDFVDDYADWDEHKGVILFRGHFAFQWLSSEP